jgi:hypothetical protein
VSPLLSPRRADLEPGAACGAERESNVACA